MPAKETIQAPLIPTASRATQELSTGLAPCEEMLMGEA